MPQQSNNVKGQLLELEKLAKKVIRKSLKDNTLDYTIQFTVSSLEPGNVKYAALITSPANGVQPITFVYDSFDLLKAALEESEKEFNRQKVEVAFHNSRINTYETKILAHKERVVILQSPNYDPEIDNIPLEEVTAEDAGKLAEALERAENEKAN